MRRCVWSRNLKNDEAIARVGPQRHRGKKFMPQVTAANLTRQAIKQSTAEHNNRKKKNIYIALLHQESKPGRQVHK